MARTFIRQDVQVRRSDVYDDTVAPTEANYETNPVSLENDLSNIRSMLHELRDTQDSNWWAALTAPSAFPGEGAAARGVQDVNDDLYDIERKRILRRRPVVGANVGAIATNAQHVILDATGELPGNTTAAVGAVTTRGTIVASIAGAFDAPSLVEVSGADALHPKNLCILVDSASGDAIVDSGGHEVYGLLQSEIVTDGHTINITNQRVQISFVVRNATSDDLELAAAGTMDALVIDYAPVERYAFDDIGEQSWLSDDFVDVAAGTTVTRQTAYDNQSTTPVDVTTNSILDLEGAGLTWSIRDDLEAALLTITEGSAGGTSAVTLGSDVDTFDNNAVSNLFAGPLTVDDDGTDIEIGVSAGQINTTSTNDFELQAGGELWLDDGNRSGSTWSIDGIKLSETQAEWSSFDTEFGEVSLFAAIIAAKNVSNRAKENANVNTNISANVLITGAAGSPNLTAQMPSYKGLNFLTEVDIFINGQLQRPGADAAANNDVYPSTVDAEKAQGAFYCEYALAYRGGNADVVQMICYGEPTP